MALSFSFPFPRSFKLWLWKVNLSRISPSLGELYLLCKRSPCIEIVLPFRGPQRLLLCASLSGGDGFAPASVTSSILAFLLLRDRGFLPCLYHGYSIGGDTDTVGAMLGLGVPSPLKQFLLCTFPIDTLKGYSVLLLLLNISSSTLCH